LEDLKNFIGLILINFIMDLLEMVLKTAATTFNNKIYLPIKGTAMGTSGKVAFNIVLLPWKSRSSRPGTHTSTAGR
jgi:hypothetical protein